MLRENIQNTRVRHIVAVAVLMGLCSCQTTEWPDLEANWECTTQWTWDNDGKSVPCSYVARASGKDNVTRTTGVLSLGDAQWDETTQSTYRIDGDKMCGTRTVTKNTPSNDAAREFEREHTDGKSIAANAMKPHDYCFQLIKKSEGKFTVKDDAEGRLTTCVRL